MDAWGCEEGVWGIMSTEKKIRKVLRKIKTADNVLQSETDWEFKYNIIFGMGIVDDLNNIGIQLNYYDPDTTYEEDVRAFVEALNCISGDLEKALML